MQLVAALISLLPLVTCALAQYPGGTGFISPAAGQSVSSTQPLNITFNPARYFEEYSENTTFYLLQGDYSDIPSQNTYLPIGAQLVGVEPNTQLGVGTESIITPAISTTMDVSGVTGTNFTIVGVETWVLTYNEENLYYAFWTQSFTMTD